MTYHKTRGGIIVTALGYRLHICWGRVTPAKPATVAPAQQQPKPQ